MELVELGHVAKAANKRRKKDGKPVGRGKFADLQSAIARGAKVEFEAEKPAPRPAAPRELPMAPSTARTVPQAAQEAVARRGRLIRTITPKRLAIAAAIPVSAGAIGYGIYRWNKKTEKPALAAPQMRHFSSKM